MKLIQISKTDVYSLNQLYLLHTASKLSTVRCIWKLTHRPFQKYIMCMIWMDKSFQNNFWSWKMTTRLAAWQHWSVFIITFCRQLQMNWNQWHMKVDLKSFPTIYGLSKLDKKSGRTRRLKLTEVVLKFVFQSHFSVYR